MSDPRDWLAVCAADALVDGGEGVRFEVGPSAADPDAGPAFVIRHEGRPHAWLNRCAHVPVELDFPEGRFFDDEARFIVCATHGAHYHPDTGQCAGGPCDGRGLVRLECRESGGTIWIRPL